MYVSFSIAMSSARVNAVYEVKSVFHRRVERNTASTDETRTCQEMQTLRPKEMNEHTAIAEKSKGDTKKPFVFTKTQEEFCFNFNL